MSKINQDLNSYKNNCKKWSFYFDFIFVKIIIITIKNIDL